MVYTLIIICWIVVETAFLCIIVILTSIFDRNGRYIHNIARVWARGILFVSRIKVTTKGFANIDPSGFYICMSNHLSNFDIPILLAFLPIQFRWLIKKELYKIPLFGFTLKRAGYIRIDRANRHSAIRSIKEAAAIIRNGVSIMIFPEGTRSKGGDLQSFKKGGFVLAVESGVPILPIVIHGTYGIMPKKQIRIIPGNVILEVCPPVEVSDYTMENKDELLKNVRNIVLDAYEKGKAQKL